MLSHHKTVKKKKSITICNRKCFDVTKMSSVENYLASLPGKIFPTTVEERQTNSKYVKNMLLLCKLISGNQN